MVYFLKLQDHRKALSTFYSHYVHVTCTASTSDRRDLPNTGGLLCPAVTPRPGIYDTGITSEPFSPLALPTGFSDLMPPSAERGVLDLERAGIMHAWALLVDNHHDGASHYQLPRAITRNQARSKCRYDPVGRA